MNDDIVIAIIGAVTSIVGSYSLVNWRLKKLEEKVDAHNSYSEKIASLTTDMAVVRNDIGYIKEAIEKLGK